MTRNGRLANQRLANVRLIGFDSKLERGSRVSTITTDCCLIVTRLFVLLSEKFKVYFTEK